MSRKFEFHSSAIYKINLVTTEASIKPIVSRDT